MQVHNQPPRARTTGPLYLRHPRLSLATGKAPGHCGKRRDFAGPFPFNPGKCQTLHGGRPFPPVLAIGPTPSAGCELTMLDTLKNFISELTGGDKQAVRFEENDY